MVVTMDRRAGACSFTFILYHFSDILVFMLKMPTLNESVNKQDEDRGKEVAINPIFQFRNIARYSHLIAYQSYKFSCNSLCQLCLLFLFILYKCVIRI